MIKEKVEELKKLKSLEEKPNVKIKDLNEKPFNSTKFFKEKKEQEEKDRMNRFSNYTHYLAKNKATSGECISIIRNSHQDTKEIIEGEPLEHFDLNAYMRSKYEN